MAKKSLKYKKCKYSIKPNTQCAVIDTTTLKRWKHLQNKKTTREKDFGWAYLHFPYHPVTRTKVLWWHFLRFFGAKTPELPCVVFLFFTMLHLVGIRKAFSFEYFIWTKWQAKHFFIISFDVTRYATKWYTTNIGIVCCFALKQWWWRWYFLASWMTE